VAVIVRMVLNAGARRGRSELMMCMWLIRVGLRVEGLGGKCMVCLLRDHS
jgi:hypothetical protein